MTVGKRDTVIDIAKREYGENWRAGVAVIAAGNNLGTDPSGNPIIREGQELNLRSLSGASSDELRQLGRAGGDMIAGNTSQREAVRALDLQRSAANPSVSGASAVTADGITMADLTMLNGAFARSDEGMPYGSIGAPRSAEAPTALQRFKEGINDFIDRQVENSNYSLPAMILGATAKAFNEVFVPGDATDVVLLAAGPFGKLGKLGKFGGIADEIAKVPLSPTQIDNIGRFAEKIPSNARDSITVKALPNSGFAVQAVSPGRIPGSYAVYEKQIDAAGKTIQYTKTTYDPAGNIVHVKDKISGGIFP